MSDIIQAEQRFIESRDNAFAAIAQTTQAAADYGGICNKLREEAGSERQFTANLMALGATLPIDETKKLMKVAARLAIKGGEMMHDRAGNQWAQAEMGLLPPRSPAAEPEREFSASDAIEVVAKCAKKVKAILENCPREKWTTDEERAFNAAIREVTLLA